MAVIVQEDVKPDRVRYSDRRKRAAAAKRMRSGKQGGWQSLSREDREFIAAVFQEYDVDGTGTMVRGANPTRRAPLSPSLFPPSNLSPDDARVPPFPPFAGRGAD